MTSIWRSTARYMPLQFRPWRTTESASTRRSKNSEKTRRWRLYFASWRRKERERGGASLTSFAKDISPWGWRGSACGRAKGIQDSLQRTTALSRRRTVGLGHPANQAEGLSGVGWFIVCLSTIRSSLWRGAHTRTPRLPLTPRPPYVGPRTPAARTTPTRTQPARFAIRPRSQLRRRRRRG